VADIWLTKPSTEPSAVLAAQIVERLDITLPVNIESLAASAADIFEEPWPYGGCDAVVVGLLSERPSIFLRKGLHHRRRRFTLAHEYGHLNMAWHIGVVGCHPETRQFEEEPLEPAPQVASVTAWWRLEEQEAEATRFASYLLMPDAIIRPFIASMDMGDVLRALDKADVSASAALMRLRRMLQPGFCFVVLDELGRKKIYSSPGTSLSAVEAGSELRSLRKASYGSGKATVGGRSVRWFRLTDFAEFEPVDDPRSTTSLARSAIAANIANPEDRESFYRSINGVAGGILSKERAETVTQALSILRQKFRNHSQYGAIISHPDFDLYLRRKAEEWGLRRGL
jgi:hypothetical protein